VGKLGWAEKVINTPSSHRVHHAVNERYLDKNYAATLITWDRLFGTYEPEGEVPVYGISKPLRSFNPLHAQLHAWGELWQMSRQAPSLGEALKVWVKSPAWKPEWHKVEPYPARTGKYDVAAPRGLQRYAVISFAFPIFGTFAAMMWGHQLPVGGLALAVGWIVLSLVSLCGLLEGKAYAPALELGRLALLAGAAGAFFWGQPALPIAVGAALALAIGSAAMLRVARGALL
jgi:alkylglycerol monooxygenase